MKKLSDIEVQMKNVHIPVEKTTNDIDNGAAVPLFLLQRNYIPLYKHACISRSVEKEQVVVVKSRRMKRKTVLDMLPLLFLCLFQRVEKSNDEGLLNLLKIENLQLGDKSNKILTVRKCSSRVL